ncbi:amino acid ABC transporter permease [Lachnospiraceae bacterium]|nr:amino acid ABC transporter permease [Lachnospiraceae bacterium]
MQNFIDEFTLNFIEKNRYQYIIEGFVNTLIISLFAVLVGIVIGFLVAIIRSSHDKTGRMKAGNFICRIYLTVMRGTPTMIQLLIIYYVIFATVNIPKVFVAVVAFGLNSGAYVAEIVRSGIMSVDEGQFEAGRSLGLNYRQTMQFIVMPQAFKNVLPALGNEFIVLLKETSISGYIGLTDLTHGGDIIRGITFSAFMPLVAVALIYLLLVTGLSWCVNKLERRLRVNER